LSTSVDAATNYVDTNVAAGQTYTYAVSAYGIDGVESAQSTSVSVTIPTP
jgi:fibronectin type 3 domain-containing protein